MLCTPPASEDVVIEASPSALFTFASDAGLIRLLPPSLNCTVPVGVSGLKAPMTFALNVAGEPNGKLAGPLR